MTTTKLLEDRLEHLSDRQSHLARLLLTTLRPGVREKILTEKTLVDNELNTAHKQLAYAQRGYGLR